MSEVEIFIGSDGIARRAPKYRMTVYGETADDLLRTERLFAAHESLAALCRRIADAGRAGPSPSAESWAMIVATAEGLIGEGIVPLDAPLPAPPAAASAPSLPEPKAPPKGIGVADPKDFELVDEDEVGDLGDLDFDSDDETAPEAEAETGIDAEAVILEPTVATPDAPSAESLDAIAKSVLAAAGEPPTPPRLSPQRIQPAPPAPPAPATEADSADDFEIEMEDDIEELSPDAVLGETIAESEADAATIAERDLTTANRIEWRDEFSVGSPEMDRDHRVLIDLINQIAPAMESGDEAMTVVGSVLKALWDYTGYHFAREEALQSLAEFPDFDAHKDKHEALKNAVHSRLQAFAADPGTVDVAELLTFLRTWLIQHILKEDMRYKPFVSGRSDLEDAISEVSFLDSMDDDEEDVDLMEQLSEAGLGTEE